MENDLAVLRDLPTHVAVCPDVRAQRVSSLRIVEGIVRPSIRLAGFHDECIFLTPARQVL